MSVSLCRRIFLWEINKNNFYFIFLSIRLDISLIFFSACTSDNECTATGQTCEIPLQLCVCESESGQKNPCADGEKCANKMCGPEKCDDACFGETADGCDANGKCLCGTGDQCGDGHACIVGECRCGNNPGCNAGQKCSNGNCVSAADTTTSAPTTPATTTPGNIRNRIVFFIEREKCVENVGKRFWCFQSVQETFSVNYVLAVLCNTQDFHQVFFEEIKVKTDCFFFSS